MTVPEPRFLCVHVPEFAAQARLRHRPALRARAVVVLDGKPPLQTVCSATRKARERGVTRGTTRAELDGFPGVESLLRSEPEERSAAAALLSTLWRFSPRIEVLPAHDGAHRLVADVAGTESLFGPPASLARAVQREAEALGLMVRCAVSVNFQAALCAAPFAKTTPRLIPRGDESAALAALPLGAIATLTEAQHETFTSWGLRTLGEVGALPEAQLIARMSQVGKQIRLLARGECPHVLQPEEERFALEEHASFDSPVEMLDSLLFVLGPMLDQLIRCASSRALALASLTVRLQLTNHAAEDVAVAQEAKAYARTIKPALPLSDHRVLLKLLHLELQAYPPGAPVAAVELAAEPGDCARAQLGLFSPQLPEPSRLEVTLARLRALVGEGRVGRPQLRDAHKPDSYSMETFTAPAPTGRAAATEPSVDAREERRAFALRRLRPPVPLSMRLAQGRPQLFFWQGTRFEVIAAHGPWRQSGDWWSGTAWSHEEWDVTAAAADGTTLACRIARDLLHRHWRLDGLYD